MNAFLDSNTGQNASAVPCLEKRADCANEPQELLISKELHLQNYPQIPSKTPKIPEKTPQKAGKTVAEPQRIRAINVWRRPRLIGIELGLLADATQRHASPARARIAAFAELKNTELLEHRKSQPARKNSELPNEPRSE